MSFSLLRAQNESILSLHKMLVTKEAKGWKEKSRQQGAHLFKHFFVLWGYNSQTMET